MGSALATRCPCDLPDYRVSGVRFNHIIPLSITPVALNKLTVF